MSLQEYMAFMISRETENVQSSSEVEQAFRALTSGDKPFITSQELYAVCQNFYVKVSILPLLEAKIYQHYIWRGLRRKLIFHIGTCICLKLNSTMVSIKFHEIGKNYNLVLGLKDNFYMGTI